MGTVGTIGYRRNKYVEGIRGWYPKRSETFLNKPKHPDDRKRVAHISYFVLLWSLW